jgi:hypothetical protein
MTVKPRHRSWRTADGSGAVVAVLVSPTILNGVGGPLGVARVRDLARNQQLLGRASSTVGEENAHAVCHIQIFVTDRDQRAVSC